MDIEKSIADGLEIDRDGEVVPFTVPLLQLVIDFMVLWSLVLVPVLVEWVDSRPKTTRKDF